MVSMGEHLLNISIVTPSYNQGSFINEAIESVVLQQVPDVQHRIVDGASGDGTVEILRQCDSSPDRKHVKWSSEPDSGQSDALNRGLREATGDVIGWLNSDDRYRPGCFVQIQKAFRENPGVDVLYGDYTVMDKEGTIRRIRREIEFNSFVLQYHRVLYIATAATFFRRRIFDDGNWLKNDLHYAMDYDLFVRLAMAGYKIKHIPVLLADVRVHPECKSYAKANEMHRERDMLMRTHSQIARKEWTPTVKSLAYTGAQTVAGAIRYSEKMVRGYYWKH
jgi:glycosyltransferase involved in cell wall biosynthesis